MATVRLLPVDDDEQYVNHVYRLIGVWLLVTLLVGIVFAFIAL
jgi:hypothetical protein